MLFLLVSTSLASPHPCSIAWASEETAYAWCPYSQQCYEIRNNTFGTISEKPLRPCLEQVQSDTQPATVGPTVEEVVDGQRVTARIVDKHGEMLDEHVSTRPPLPQNPSL